VTLASRVDFREHSYRLGSDDAARVDFHRMLTALIQVQHPTATEVRANPGDWGIDTFVGSLVHKINIWQSKYFINGMGDSQKSQIRESVKSAMQSAAREKYIVETWTLCVPRELDAKERRWWDNKVREWKKLYPDVTFDLWDPPRLRGYLMTPEADHVLQEFYGPERVWIRPTTAATDSPSPAVVTRPVDVDFDGALFMTQLNEAGMIETDAQKTAFFNAEILARDIENRGVPEEVSAFTSLDAEVWILWEDEFNLVGRPPVDQVEHCARNLFVKVMREIRALSPPPSLSVRPVHTAGIMHQIVDTKRAGWVSHWRDIADAHSKSPTVSADPVVGGEGVVP
jgi:hypothetical protein